MTVDACIVVQDGNNSENNHRKAGKRHLVIAVDGPAASGKGTLARNIAKYYGVNYLDTGRLYRAVAFKVMDMGIDSDNIPVDIAAKIAAELQPEDINNPYLTHETVGNMASIVSAIPEVRSALFAYQRQFADLPGGAVLDGRDIGTVICPSADCKLFITASLQARAKRRFKELREKGLDVTYEGVLADLENRDLRDSRRKVSPLIAASDAICIDTTELDVETVFNKVIDVINAKVASSR